MNTMKLFEKKIATYEDVEAFVNDLVTNHNFKRAITRKDGFYKENYESKNTHLCYVGSNNKGDFISVWSRIGSKRQEADYGVRIHEDMVKKLSRKSEALTLLMSQFTVSANLEDSNEYRVSFSNLEDVKTFFNTLFAYVEAVEAKKIVKAVEAIESVTA